MIDRLTFYHPAEERLNVISHGFGLVLSIGAFALLLTQAYQQGDRIHLASYAVYGASLVIMYSASTLYHYVQEPGLRYKLNIADHAAIYVLIAGSYTPFTLNVIEAPLGMTLFVIVWAIALIGVTLKLFFTGRFGKISTVVYVLMGWLGIFGIQSLLESLPVAAVVWLVAGGVSYTIGAVLYGLKSIKFNHAIFHVFVLLGSVCHFFSVFLYIIPSQKS